MYLNTIYGIVVSFLVTDKIALSYSSCRGKMLKDVSVRMYATFNHTLSAKLLSGRRLDCDSTLQSLGKYMPRSDAL